MKRFTVAGRKGLQFNLYGHKYQVGWPWVVMVVVIAALLLQRGLEAMGAEWLLGVVSSMMVIILLLWQQFQIRIMQARLDRLDRLVSQKRLPISSKAVRRMDLADKALDEFFGDERTRH